MKYALISDIHGNYPALRAVLDDAEKMKVEQYIFVGDYYMGVPFTERVMALIKELAPRSCMIRGNQEDRVEMLSGSAWKERSDGQFQATYWYYSQLSEEDKKFLMNLPRLVTLDGGLHIAHRSSDFIGNAETSIFSRRLIPFFQGKRPIRTEINAAISEILEANGELAREATALEDGIYIFGHSHMQWHKQYGQKYLINPGSCGIPMDFAGGAPYTVLETIDGEAIITERRAAYDEEQVTDAMRKSPLARRDAVWNEILLSEFQCHHEILVRFLEYAETYAIAIGDSKRPYSKQTWNAAFTE